jgi:uncharacterized membrane protein
MKRIIFLLLVAFLATIAGCYYDNEERLYPEVASGCDLSNVTYAVNVKPILQASCYSCHSNSNALHSGGGVALENYTDVVSFVNNGKLMGTIRHDSGYIPMPNGGGKLTDCEINQLQTWIDNGKPNN